MLDAQRAWNTAIVWACLLSLQDCFVHWRGAARLGLKQDPFSAEPRAGAGSQEFSAWPRILCRILKCSVTLGMLGMSRLRGKGQSQERGREQGAGMGQDRASSQIVIWIRDLISKTVAELPGQGVALRVRGRNQGAS